MSNAAMDEVEEILDPAVSITPDIEPELVEFLPRGYLSPSQIGTYLKCGHLWYLRYIVGLAPRTSARMFQGIQVHRAVERVLNARLITGDIPPADLATDTFSDAFEEQKGLIDDWEGQEKSSVKDIGIKCANEYHLEALPKATPICVEKEFHRTVTTADGKVNIPILGRIDNIQVQSHGEDEYQAIRASVLSQPKTTALPKVKKPLRIHDLKVTTDKWSDADLKNDLQFAIYAGAENVPDVQVDQLVKGRAKVQKPRYEVITSVMQPRDVEHAFEVAEGVGRGIAKGVFVKTDPSNWWCTAQWCSMWSNCRGKTK